MNSLHPQPKGACPGRWPRLRPCAAERRAQAGAIVLIAFLLGVVAGVAGAVYGIAPLDVVGGLAEAGVAFGLAVRGGVTT